MDPALFATWPGWSARRALVLTLPAERWAPPPSSVLIDESWFAPQRELHVTVANRRLGQQLHPDLGTARPRVKAARTAFERLDWRFRRTGRFMRLEKHELASFGHGRRIGSIIELIELPAMAMFYRELEIMIGRELLVPPPHITLYTLGRSRGIGVPDDAALRRLKVRDVSARELEGDAQRPQPSSVSTPRSASPARSY